MTTRLTDEVIRQRIRDYCHLQDGADLRDATRLEERINGLCEALGADVDGEAFGKAILESVGIGVVQVNPTWIFAEEYDYGDAPITQ
mgnify:CR=1 FL=1